MFIVHTLISGIQVVIQKLRTQSVAEKILSVVMLHATFKLIEGMIPV